jgi:hypothetical protein
MNRPSLTTYLTLCTEFYDLAQHLHDAQALAFYMDYARQAQGKILEPMCGTGRFLIPMLQAGLDAEGFDASAYMLDALKKKYALISSNQPSVWQQFVQDFNTDIQYQLIFVPYGSWGLITDLDDSINGLETMYKHLACGGKFIVEIETVASVPDSCGVWCRGIHTRADGSHIAINTLSSYDQETQIFRSLCRYESIVQNSIVATETEDYQQYLYQCTQMDQLLANVGFTKIKKYRDYEKNPVVDHNTHTIIYECTK